ncbi:MAG: MFS transporter [Desulfurococcaceae archaeon]|nr:MFS transporter [Desulfurococcaceae archaeon]
MRRLAYSLAATLSTFMWGIYFSFTRRYLSVELGGGTRAVLLITGLEWVYAFFAVLAGRLVNTLGGRNLIRLSSIGFLPLLAAATLRDPNLLALVLSLSSLAWSVSWPVILTAVFSSSRGRYGWVYSIFTLGTGLGWSAGSVAMGFIYSAGGPVLVFSTCSLLYLLSYLIFSELCPGDAELHSKDPREGFGEVRRLWYILIPYTLTVFSRELYYSVAPVKLSTELAKLLRDSPESLQYVAFGIVYGGITSILSIPTRVICGKLTDLYNPLLLLVISSLAYLVSYWGFVLTEGLVSIVIWQLPLYPLVDTAVSVGLAKATSGSSRTTALGASLAFSALGGLAVLPLTASPELSQGVIGALVTFALTISITLATCYYRRHPTQA